MCAINGIFAYHYAALPVSVAELRRTRDRMFSRGPDGEGEWLSGDGTVGFGHRRLSIIDVTEAGAQPMARDDGSCVVTFNGEIYNYRELRRDLEQKGYHFKSNSDTEVLLHLYAEKGDGMLQDLRGMFAFAIWDAQRETLFLARDRFGIKPLYYADDGWTFRFASQVKAIMASGSVSDAPSSAGLAGFFLWGNVPDPYTIYRSVRALNAGCSLIVDRAGIHAPKFYYSVKDEFALAQRKYESTAASEASKPSREQVVRDALIDSVRHHMIADVPVAIFLSAGIDSGAITGLVQEITSLSQEYDTSPVKTITLAFNERVGTSEDEAPVAEEVALLYGTNHTTRIVTYEEFEADLPLILDAMDQPTIDGINTWFAAKAANELGVKVVLSGLGGDELFAGYDSFHIVPRWHRIAFLPSRMPFLGRFARIVLTMIGSERHGWSPKSASFFEIGGSVEGAYLLKRGVFMPWELDQVMKPEFAHEDVVHLQPMSILKTSLTAGVPIAGRVAAMEYGLYLKNQLLRDSDWASMAHSVEMRVPLVDHLLLAAVAPQIADGTLLAGKTSLVNAPKRPLPSAVASRPKLGFTTPIASWLERATLDPYTIIPTLAQPNCPWARRWAYMVARNFCPEELQSA